MKRGGPIPRTARLKARGRSRFPKRRCPAFMAWCLELIRSRVVPCHCDCGRRAEQRSPRSSRGAGGYDVGNVNLLSEQCHRLLHMVGEREFEARRHCYPGQLADRAARLGQEWEERVA